MKSRIAQGALTYSKRRDQFVDGVYPVHARSGFGPFLVAENGKTYVDFVCGLGSNLLEVSNNYTLPSVQEDVLADRLHQLFPFMERMKFVKNGSDACMMAVRIARAWKQKEDTRKWTFGLGYHGNANTFISEEKPGAGTIFEFYKKFTTLDDLMAHLHGFVKCVIIEPVMLDLKVRPKLKKLRGLCDKHGIILIFDEVITGFRTPKYCFANYYGIRPDLICLGKALGNGFPISVVGGRKDLMDNPDYFCSFTFAGERHSIQQAINLLDSLTEQKINQLWKLGGWFQKEFNKLCPKLKLKGIPTRATWEGDELTKNLFWQEMVKRGYLFGKAWFLGMSHTKSLLENTLREAKSVMSMISKGKVKLEGGMAKEVFRRY